MHVSEIFALFRERYRWHRARLESRRYTPSTFAEYLRRCGAQVGVGCHIAAVDMLVGNEPYLLRIGDNVRIEPDVAFVTHDGAAWVFRHLVADLQVFGPIVLEDNCRIGRGAILCPGIRIGKNSRVAPGSLVITDVPADAEAGGIPARASRLPLRGSGAGLANPPQHLAVPRR